MPSSPFHVDEGDVPLPALVGGLENNITEVSNHLAINYLPSPPGSSHGDIHHTSDVEDEDDDEDDDDDNNEHHENLRHHHHHHQCNEHFPSPWLNAPTQPLAWSAAATTFLGAVPTEWPWVPAAMQDNSNNNTVSADSGNSRGSVDSNDATRFPYPITIVDPATHERLSRRSSRRERVMQVPRMVVASDDGCGGCCHCISAFTTTTTITSSTMLNLPSACHGESTEISDECSLQRQHGGGARGEGMGNGEGSSKVSSSSNEHDHCHHHPDRTSFPHRRRSLRHRHRRRRAIHSWPLSRGESRSATTDDRKDDDDEEEEEGDNECCCSHCGGSRHAWNDMDCDQGGPQSDEQQDRLHVCCGCDQPFGRLDHHFHDPVDWSKVCTNNNNNNNNNSNNKNKYDRTNCIPNIDHAIHDDLPLLSHPLVPDRLLHHPPNATVAHMHDNTPQNSNGLQQCQEWQMLGSERSQDGERAAPLSLGLTSTSTAAVSATYFLGDDIPVQPSWVIEEQLCRLQPPFVNGRPIDQVSSQCVRCCHLHHCPQNPTVHEPLFSPHCHHTTRYTLSASPRSFSASLLLRSPYFPQSTVEPKLSSLFTDN